MSNHHKLIILGSGPAGYTAAVYAARANLKPVIITGVEQGGQLMTTTEVDNWPADAEGVQGPELMARFLAHAERFGTEMIFDQIHTVDLQNRPFTLKGDMGKYTCDALIVATGASAKYLGLPSEEAFAGKGVSACATCDGFFYKNKEVAVLGGGDTAIEEALYLANICSRVYIIHRRDEFRAAPVTLEKARANAKIEFITSATIKQAYGDKAGLAGLIINTKEGERDLKVPGVFVFVGLNVNNDVLRQENGEFVCQTEDGGQVSVDLKMQTSVPGLFAAGDIRKDAPKQVIVAAGDGAVAALSALSYIESLH